MRLAPRRAVVLALVAVTAAGCADGGAPVDVGFVVPELDPKPKASIPSKGIAAPVDRANASDAGRLKAWSRRISKVTDIPARAAQSYGLAEMSMRATDPGCHMTWTVLAGIGRAESSHGSHGGAHIHANGAVSPRILGPALDGHGHLRKVRDTDDGRFDGDKKWDRAVGPLQFLPQSWEKLGVRASGDGKTPNPSNMDDAALTAAHLLCLRGDVGTKKGWWRAVWSYNTSVAYGKTVFSGAQAYAVASRKAVAERPHS